MRASASRAFAPVVFEDFTLTTTGDLTDNNLAIDELGGGWLANTYSTMNLWTYGGSGEGLRTTDTGGSAAAVIQTNGREDVRITVECVIRKGPGADDWTWPTMIRGASTVNTDMIWAVFNGTPGDPDLQLSDVGSGLLKTWDLSALLTVQPVEGDTVKMVFECIGNDITFYSIQVNGGAVEIVNDTYTLTGDAAAAHGAGSGADYYGIGSNADPDSELQRFKSYLIEALVI